MRNLQFTNVELEGRFQFGMGKIAGQLPGSTALSFPPGPGYAGGTHVRSSSSVSHYQNQVPAYGGVDNHDDSTDYGASECQVFDEDGSLRAIQDTEAATEWYCDGLDVPGGAPPGGAEGCPQMFISAAPRQWPALYNGFCQHTINTPDWWDTKDELNAINRCPPYLRRENSLLLAATEPKRQGVSFQIPDDGTDSPDWGKEGVMPQACVPMQGIGAMDCTRNDYIYLQNLLPLKIVSGSQVLYGPATISTCSHYAGEPIVNFVATEYFWHAIPPASGPWSVNAKDSSAQMDRQNAMEAVVSPHVHFVTNGGCYRLDYTGDSGLFRTNIFSLINANMKLRTGRIHEPRNPVNPENDWSVVIESWFTFPGKINVFFNEAYVPPVARANR
eukprot:COSAG05_NODE_5058_length_1276_cov_1.232795_1_plen_386_part_10